MKTIVLILSTVIFLAGCKRDNDNVKISSSQLAAVQELNSSYQNARLYNDSLVYAIRGTISHFDSAMIHYYDSKYHYYDSKFDSCHHRYEHNYISADHTHNACGMVGMHNTQNDMMGGMACKCCTNGGHSADLHQQMTALHNVHAQYYPH